MIQWDLMKPDALLTAKCRFKNFGTPIAMFWNTILEAGSLDLVRK